MRILPKTVGPALHQRDLPHKRGATVRVKWELMETRSKAHKRSRFRTEAIAPVSRQEIKRPRKQDTSVALT